MDHMACRSQFLILVELTRITKAAQCIAEELLIKDKNNALKLLHGSSFLGTQEVPYILCLHCNNIQLLMFYGKGY